MRTKIFVICSFLLRTILMTACDPKNGCLECSPENICLSCSEPFTLTSGTCMIIRNIEETDSTFDGIGGKIQLVPLNSNYDTLQEDSYFFDGDSGSNFGGNQLSIADCAFQIGSECMICQNGYFLKNSLCYQKLGKCLQLSEDNLCNQCQDRLILNQQKQCIDPKCQIWDYYSCSQCLPGFVLAPDGICEDPHCSQVKEGKCQKCEENYYQDPAQNGRCVQLSILAPNCLEPKQENNQIICGKCQRNYEIQKGLCRNLCVRESPTSASCLQCVEGYFLHSFRGCLLIPPGCLLPIDGDDSVKCLSCDQDYFLDAENNCKSTNEICKKKKNGVCIDCIEGFVLNPKNNSCFSEIENCIEYSGEFCRQCEANHVLNRNRSRCTNREGCKLFDPTGICLSCKSEYILRDGQCRFVDPLCKSMREETGQCLQCYQGYFIVENRCSSDMPDNCIRLEGGKCAQCSQGFYLKNWQCKEMPEGCQIFNINKQECTSCYPEYFMRGTSCTLIDQSLTFIQRSDINCEKFSVREGLCYSCYPSFYISRNKCFQANPLCQTFNPNGGDCLSCFSGYRLDVGKCVVGESTTPDTIDPSDNCNYFDLPNNVCEKCVTRFYLSNGRCLPVSNTCKNYSQTTGSCSSCFSGYTLQNGECQLVSSIAVANCAVLDPNNQSICNECIDRYYLQEGQCKHVSILCNRYRPEDGSCIDCILGYLMIGDECKQPALGEDKNCAEYDLSAFCLRCVDGYEIVNYKCQPI